MSYLNNVRLIFSGTFQADISTVNNDVRHYDNGTFLPRFQDLQSNANPDGPLNGWFSPNGSGAFRLIDCRVSSVCYKDGTSQSDPAKDPVIGMLIGGSNTRVSGKLVDLDPQWQMASQIWGLEVKLTNDKGAAMFGGKFRPNAFRDILFTRVGGPAGDGGASAYFQSVIDGVSFAEGAPKSTFLKDLREATADGLLSIRLMTFGYVGGPTRSPRYTLGTVLGVIGPCASADEPSSFVWGRRFTPKPIEPPPQPPEQQPATSFQGINYFTALVDEDAKRLFLDLGNALPLADTDGSLMDIGSLSVGLLLDGSLTEQDPVTPQSFQSVGTIPYSDKNWLAATSGIVSFPLTTAQIGQARNTSLALVTQPTNGGGPAVVAMRESQDGILVCAEPSALRIDSPDSKKTTIFAAKFGKPISVVVNTVQTGPQGGAGGGIPNEIDPPAAAIPVMGQPETMLDIPPSVTTGSERPHRPDGEGQCDRHATRLSRWSGLSHPVRRQRPAGHRLQPSRSHRRACAKRLHGSSEADMGRREGHPDAIRQSLSDHEPEAVRHRRSCRGEAKRAPAAARLRPRHQRPELHAGDSRLVEAQAADDPRLPRSPRDRGGRDTAAGNEATAGRADGPCGGCATCADGGGARADWRQDAIRPHAADHAQVVLNKPHWGASC